MIDQGDIEVVHLTFRWLDSIIEIAYTENRNITPNATKTEIVMVDTKLIPEDELNDLLSSIRDLIDAGLGEIRVPSPPIR